MRLGLFGGSFDPVHLGHLLLAEHCRGACRLDRVLFLPAGVPPHKRRQQRSPAVQRVEMLELAVGGNPAFEVSTHEVEREGLSYTVDTLRHFSEELPGDELFFLLGADMLVDLPNWREAAEVCRLATPVAVARPGSEPLDFQILSPIASTARIAQIEAARVEMPGIDLASSEIRRRVGAGESIRYQIPRAVEEYIHEHELYRRPPE